MLPVCFTDSALPSSLALSLGPHLQRRVCGLGLAVWAVDIPPRAPWPWGASVRMLCHQNRTSEATQLHVSHPSLLDTHQGLWEQLLTGGKATETHRAEGGGQVIGLAEGRQDLSPGLCDSGLLPQPWFMTQV